MADGRILMLKAKRALAPESVKIEGKAQLMQEGLVVLSGVDIIKYSHRPADIAE